MANRSKNKGDRAELEVQGILRELLGVPARRMLGAGRLDDVGDIDQVPNTTISVANWADINRCLREKLGPLDDQRERAGNTFAAMWARRIGGGFVVCQTPEQWATMWREAQPAPSQRQKKAPVDPIKAKRDKELREFLAMKFPAPKEKDLKPW